MSEIPNYPRDGCSLPYHPVIKADSVTTKVRVFFDAFARSSSGKSLNDLLMIGPTIQDDLFTLTIRFRTYKYVLAADIAKMYRQINIHLEDRRYHKILWRENINDPIKTYQLNTVTYRISTITDNTYSTTASTRRRTELSNRDTGLETGFLCRRSANRGKHSREGNFVTQ